MGSCHESISDSQGNVDNRSVLTQVRPLMDRAITAYPETLEWLAETVAVTAPVPAGIVKVPV